MNCHFLPVKELFIFFLIAELSLQMKHSGPCKGKSKGRGQGQGQGLGQGLPQYNNSKLHYNFYKTIFGNLTAKFSKLF